MTISNRTAVSLGALALALAATPVAAQDAPIIQPSAPGQESRVIGADEAIRLADTQYVAADVTFMQAMIPHHYQALQLARLVEDRTNNTDLAEIAGRIESGQEDEIAFMQDWLRRRGEDAPDPAASARADSAMAASAMDHAGMDHSMHGGGGTAAAIHTEHMAGMATPQQMAQLAAATGAEFDRLFLTLMIAHHKGALDMAETLLDAPGSAYDPTLYRFVSDVQNDQSTEIDRMDALLKGVSTDPRASLAAGLFDAESAISGLELVASLRKPTGFFDPENPGELQPAVPPADDESEDETGDEEAVADEEASERDPNGNGEEGTVFGSRYPLLSFSNTDMAFAGDTLVVGNYHGFNIYRLGDDGVPGLVSSVVCPGGQGDVSIAGNLLIMSVEQTRGRVDCGRQGVDRDASPDRFRGLRIFDISDLTRPRQVGGVQTCRGSHTHSIVAEDDTRVVVYNSGTAGVRDSEELAGCSYFGTSEDGTSLFSIDVIEIPKANPAAARIVDSPRVFADLETGEIEGLWRGGDHGEGTQSTYNTDQCHDITVFPTKQIAAGACSGNGIVLDISEPLAPKRIDDVTDRGFAYWHSATFNNDGTKVVFTDEWGGGARPRCRTFDPINWGADAIYDIQDGQLAFRSHYKMPAPQSDKENCVAHNGSIVPVPGRDIFVQAWYQGGISIMDFTDSANPVEIAYFDRGPISDEQATVGGYWSVYYYDGHIYGTEITRGLDVFGLVPSEYLTANEIAAAALADTGGAFNPQQQYPVQWPIDARVALALVDGLERTGTFDAALATELRGRLDGAAAGRCGTSPAWYPALMQRMAGLNGADSRVAMLGTQLEGLFGC